MKFPGRRKSQHYFPVEKDKRVPLDTDFVSKQTTYIIGIEQLIVDIEAGVNSDYLAKYNILKGQSIVLDDKTIETIYTDLTANNKIKGEFAGGTIGNTLHNYSVLSDNKSVCLASVPKNITVGDYAFRYICTTNSHVDFSYLEPKNGKMARAICFVTEDGERSFALGKGIMNELSEEFIPEDVICNSSGLLITSYLLRDENAPLYNSTIKAVRIAKKNNVPIILSLGTSLLIDEKREFFKNFIKGYVTVIAMNEMEAKALVDENDPLLALDKALEYSDMVFLTAGAEGLYIGGYVDKENARETKDMIYSKSIPEYNKYEYSRCMLKNECREHTKIFSHINPYMGGPGKNIKNTNGAGDAALAALLHDISANRYHKTTVPNSSKHVTNYLTYSSIHQICKYANRVSYEVLIQNSPRLSKELPVKEDNLEEGYWAQ